jgi:hypothetical protein
VEWLNSHPILASFWFTLVVATWIGGIVGLPLLLMRMPADYFARDRSARSRQSRHPVVRAVLLLLKNLLGVAALLAGLVMLFTPGQGLVGIVLGIWLLDIPGKEALEKRVIGHPRVLRTINKLRGKAGQPPLVVDG